MAERTYEDDPNYDPNDPWGSQRTQDGTEPIEMPEGQQTQQQTTTQPTQTWSAGANAGQNVTLLGFDTAKLEDPNGGNPEVGKYNDAVRTFYNGLKQDVGLSRGGLTNMINYIKANGFPNARAVGDDKIDFGDGNGPIDVIRSDGQIVFQNTTGNPTWETQHGYAPSGTISQMMSTGSQMMSTGDAAFDQRVSEIMAGQPTWSYDDAKAWAMRYGPGPSASGASAGGASEVDPFAAMGGGVKLPNGAWVPKDHPLAQAYLASQPGSGQAPGQPGSGAPESDHTPTKDELLRMLLARADQSLNINRDDPIIKNQSDAYKAQQERARRNYLADQAEQGGPYNQGQMATAARSTAEALGQNVGGFEAELMGRELTARREEIQNALDSMGNLLTEQERQALQRELAQLDASLRRQQMDQQNAQFGAQLSQADRHFLAELAQRDRLANADNDYRYAQLGENSRQFDDRLGFDATQQSNYWDWLQRGN